MRNQDILVFGPKNNCVECVRWWAAFLRSQRFFWHPYWHTYIWCMSEHHTCQICHIWHIWHIWHTWHLAYDMYKYVNMGVKRSVRTSGMQPTILYILKIVFRAKNLNILIPHFSFVFFRIFFVYFTILETPLNDKIGFWTRRDNGLAVNLLKSGPFK